MLLSINTKSLSYSSVICLQSVYKTLLRTLFCNNKHFKNKLAEKTNKIPPRYNALGVQMLSEGLHKQLFKECHLKGYQANAVIEKELQSSIEHLSKFDLWNKNVGNHESVDFVLPKFKGKNINEMFTNFAVEQARVYAKSLHTLVCDQLPPMPGKNVWSKNPGWTKYTSKQDGTFVTEPIEYPTCSALIFDCEVLVNCADVPIIAVAASANAWFSWTSNHVLQGNSNITNDLQSLIPMECTETALTSPRKTPAKLIIGHNVGYDRARIKEQYYPQVTNTRFLDTMSMHIAVSGFSSQQRMSKAVVKEGDEEVDKESSLLDSSWLNAGSLNNLSAVHKYYCNKPLDKTTREVFVKGNMQDVQKEFYELMEYCAKDVQATYNVLQKLTPLYFSHFPHVVTFAGMLELGQMYLPVNKNWNHYVQSCQQEYDNLNMELKKNLIDLMNDACHLFYDDKYKTDQWLCEMDWSVKTKKMIKSPRKGFVQPVQQPKKIRLFVQNQCSNTREDNVLLGKVFSTGESTQSSLIEKLLQTANRLPLVQTHMPGYPKWYSELHFKKDDPEWDLDATKLSTLTRATPRLLRMTWMSYCLHYQEKLGWGYLIPQNISLESKKKSLTTDEDALNEIEDSENKQAGIFMAHTPAESVEGLPGDVTFHRLPHKSGIGKNVGSPLSHDFIDHIERGFLSSADHSNARRCLEINKLCSYWRSAQRRIISQMCIDLDDQSLPEIITKNPMYNSDLGCGAIVPQVTVCGAVSRRAVERTWLTASNVESDRIGSELKSMIQAPPGFSFVGADVDSQELWIASLLGDASSIREHGCTALSWMTISGSKKDGTDLHSKTAQAIGMTRSEAKIFNYARMYGAGKKAALQNYMQHNQGVPKEECIEKINKLYDMTKGQLLYKLSSDAIWIIKKTNMHVSPTVKSTFYATFAEIKQIEQAAAKAFGHAKTISAKDLIAEEKWVGGIESHMFNAMNKIATSDSPRTPVLKCQISSALLPSKVNTNFLPSRMNWVVQSSAVDYLHLLVVAMRWLITEFQLEARFVLSIHDEVRYLSSTKHQHLVALALQIANLLTRSMFAYQLGMHDLPMSVAFFSCVEVDRVIRKECNDNCVTPSNPNGLESKYGIPLGESFDIHDILRITNGSFDR